MNGKITTWLQGELDDRGWSHRELARRMNMSQTAVSTVISGERQPGWDFCARLGEVLGVPPEQIFRMAGLLPAMPTQSEEDLQRLMELAKSLPPEDRQLVLDFAQWRLDKLRG